MTRKRAIKILEDILKPKEENGLPKDLGYIVEIHEAIKLAIKHLKVRN